MNMKRLLVLLLLICLVLGTSACSKEQNPVNSSAPENINVESVPENIEEPEAQSPVAEVVDWIEIPEFSVTIQGTEITNDDMASYPVYSVQTTSTNTYGTTTTRVYIGYTISDVLKAAGVSEAFSTLATIADDGYTVSINEQVALDPTTLMAFYEDDKAFIIGPWFAPCVSNVSPDYLRDLASITLES